MGILDRFYSFLGNGDIMRGTKIFDLCLAALFVIIILIAVICVIVGMRNDRKIKEVSLVSDKARKARERQFHSVFNETSDSGAVIAASADADRDDDGVELGERRRLRVNRHVAIENMHRNHGDNPESYENKAPKVSLRRVPQNPPEQVKDQHPVGNDTSSMTQEQSGGSWNPTDTGEFHKQSSPMASQSTAMDRDYGQENEESYSPRHARHAKPADGKNPFSRPIGINDIKERR